MSDQPVAQDSWWQPLQQRIAAAYSATQAASIKQFARQYFASTADSELAKFTDQEVFNSVRDAWRFLQQRQADGRKIRFVQRRLGKDQRRQNETSIYLLLNDMPFLVDSTRQALTRHGVIVRSIHNTVLHVERAGRTAKTRGRLKRVVFSSTPGLTAEALSCINCAHIDEERFGEIEAILQDTLLHVQAAVEDFAPMCDQARKFQQTLQSCLQTRDTASTETRGNAGPTDQAMTTPLPVSRDELEESIAFISWLLDNHFTFLGYEKYRILTSGTEQILQLERDSLLGVSRLKTDLKPRVNLKSLPKGTAALILRPQVCTFAKSSNPSKVHRPVRYDYVLLKEFDARGKVVIEHRLLGLYTSSVYFQQATEIPLVRNKVNAVLKQSGFAPNGHSSKDLLQVINLFPRDELFQITERQLFATALEITQTQETQTCKLFIRKDSYGRFYSCLVYIPRDMFNTRVRTRIRAFLERELQAGEAEYTVSLSESLLVRLHLILQADDIQRTRYQQEELEARLVQLVKPWDQYFLDALRYRYLDNEANRLYQLYRDAWSASYKETYFGVDALRDIARIEEVVTTRSLSLDFNTGSLNVGAQHSFKIFSSQGQLFLSNVTPILENLGLGIISEKAFLLRAKSGQAVWLHDFALQVGKGRRNHRLQSTLSATLKRNFEEGFRAIWEQRAEDDEFNALIISADLGWRDVALLRACAAWLKQIQFGYSSQFIARTLSRHGAISDLLVRYFHALFAPATGDEKQAARVRHQLTAAIDQVANLSEDSVLRACLNLMDVTVRTNFFQTDQQGELKDYFSFKFLPERIQGMPLPRPAFEIFVYSRSMEGVHLRGGLVARGGLRWSDRREDYRTEILGLLKAQQVKNAVIVPMGAKGGFVVKQEAADQQPSLTQGIACYQTFIHGLLDITDNLLDGKLVPPREVVRRDGDDPYLVVAADKGTATFSDLANAIAGEHGFWLGDGFASGGSHGYDHKQMGITARGAWVSVQRHFRELGIDLQKQDFTVVGIGDMSGDVFGNGMLQSRHIQLVAAFNHRHIFIDPQPDAATGFRERRRLWRKSRSAWSDYDGKLISKGGGVFSRRQKAIAISPQMRQRFAIEQDSLTPDQLIHQLLQSAVDLLWNGGIGTYVKASTEKHSEVGDKTNDVLRINGRDLRCKVVGEGGNLGMTQAGRIEYALCGGISITDFVDNCAGVDCSDHEVNSKILLNGLQQTGRLSQSRRNALLQSMTDEIAKLVLRNNYAQVQAIGIASAEAEVRHREYSALAGFLEQQAGLDRQLEFLPDPEGLEERAARGQFLTRPEIAVLGSWMKMYLKATLVDADYLERDYLTRYLHQAFPHQLVRRYRAELQQHPLRREIIATELASEVVNNLGPGFVYQLVDTTAVTVPEVVKTAIIAMDVFDIRKPWAAIEKLDYQVPAAIQTEMMTGLMRLIRRSARWLLLQRQTRMDCQSEITRLAKPVAAFRRMLPGKLPEDFRQLFDDRMTRLQAQGVPSSLALTVCRADFLLPATALAETATITGESLASIVTVYYQLGELLRLNWLGRMIQQVPVANHWQALARENCLDDLSWQQHALTRNVVQANAMRHPAGKRSAANQIKHWRQHHEPRIQRSNAILQRLQTEPATDHAMFSVALRELATLARSTACADFARPASID